MSAIRSSDSGCLIFLAAHSVASPPPLSLPELSLASPTLSDRSPRPPSSESSTPWSAAVVVGSSLSSELSGVSLVRLSEDSEEEQGKLLHICGGRCEVAPPAASSGPEKLWEQGWHLGQGVPWETGQLQDKV